MKTVIDKANTRGYFNHGWLKTYHTFSFADYYNPRRIHFGALRVLNDDTVAPGEGFGMHPHKNMEVVSIPLQGYLRHGDSVQNESTIAPGEIQVMSTGTGIYHSEYNASKTEDAKFLQIWIIPNVEGTKPEYHNYDIRPLLKRNELATFISPSGNTPAHLLQDAWFSMGTLDAGQSVTYRMHKPRTGVYIFIIARKLAKGLQQVRVDFYDINGQIYFGELTFFHFSGNCPFQPVEWDERIGSWWTLEK